MSAAGPALADIDAAIAQGEWWSNGLRELAETGVAMARALAAEVTAGGRRASAVADQVIRITDAIQRAAAMDMRLDETAAAARAKAQAQAAAESAAREKARAQAKARRGARKEQVRELAMEVIDREATDRQDHENLSLALDQRLTFDPAYTDIANLPLRETVERIRADLTITPDWRRREAGEWKPRDPVLQSGWPDPPPDDAPPDRPSRLVQRLQKCATVGI